MKAAVRRLVLKLSARLGYRITRVHADAPDVSIRFDKFTRFLDAYEWLLERTLDDGPIPVNELRPLLLSRLAGTEIPEAYFLVRALARTRHIPGDVCEFGVAQGETSGLIASEIRDLPKEFHLFDSFAGLPRPTAEDTL